MKTVYLGPDKLPVPAIIQGLMRTDHMSPSEILQLIDVDLELGINFLDTSDIYANGLCEELLGRAFAQRPGLREEVTLQTKCGIVSTPEGTYYDFSEKHILEACDASLKRLQTDYIDVYLLHRPDALYEPQEIASAFDKLQAAGKVKHFGVSNMNTMQMKMIQKYVRQPLVCNQLQFTLGHTKLIDQSISVNRAETASIGHDDGLLDYCRYTDCTVQAWSPFRAAKSPVTGSIIEGKIMTRPFIGSPEYLELNAAMDKMSAELGITPGALTVAWILRHPADMQVVLGSTRPERIRDACQGVNVELSRKQWYDLYRAAGNLLM